MVEDHSKVAKKIIPKGKKLKASDDDDESQPTKSNRQKWANQQKRKNKEREKWYNTMTGGMNYQMDGLKLLQLFLCLHESGLRHPI